MARVGICINPWVAANDLVVQQLGRNRIENWSQEGPGRGVWMDLSERAVCEHAHVLGNPAPQLWACPAEEAPNKQVETDCLVGISQPLQLLQCSLDVSTNTVATWQRWGGQGSATLAPLTSAAVECFVYRQPRLTLSLR